VLNSYQIFTFDSQTGNGDVQSFRVVTTSGNSDFITDTTKSHNCAGV